MLIRSMLLVALLSGCMSSRSLESRLVGKETTSLADYGPVMCGDKTVDVDMLFEEVRPQLENMLKREGIADTLEYLDYRMPTYVGVKRVSGIPYVKYLFDKTYDPNVLLSGEGGVDVIVDPCQSKILFTYMWRI